MPGQFFGVNMRHVYPISLILFSLSTFLLSGERSYAGNIFSDIWGVVTDPLKLRASSSTLSDSVNRSLFQLSGMESVVNSHVQERLLQIREIITSAIDGEAKVVNEAIDRMAALEVQINKDAVSLIYRTQCFTEVALLDQARRAFEKILEDISLSEPGIEIFGYKFVKYSSKKVIIENPDVAYNEAKKVILEKLAKSVTNQSNAYEILSTYQNLERSARFVRCHYIDQALAVKYTREINELEVLSAPWVGVVDVVMQ